LAKYIPSFAQFIASPGAFSHSVKLARCGELAACHAAREWAARDEPVRTRRVVLTELTNIFMR